jgi:hypothetical protein
VNLSDQIMVLLVLGFTILFIYSVGEFFLRRRKQEEVPPVTPITEEGLVQFDDLPPGLAVALAWSEPGENPAWHRQMQAEVRSQMPVLARALDRMVEN